MNDKHNNIIDFIESLNSSITTFLSMTRDEQKKIDQTQAGLTSEKELHLKQNYLKFKQCDDLDCTCHNRDEGRCWLIENTDCKNKDQAQYSDKQDMCDTCEIFKNHTDMMYTTLQSNIEKLLRHLESKVDLQNEDAVKDKLTGLYTRHYLTLIRKREMERADRQNLPVSVIFFSLNKFKEVNDSYGRLMGDEVLKEFSRFLIEITRKEDLVFRISSDQFMLFMVGAEKVHRRKVEMRLDEANRIWKDKVKDLPVQLSFSFGGATKKGEINLDHLLVQAGTRMEEYRLVH